MKTFPSRFSKHKSGVTLDECLLIAALVWIAIVVGVQFIRAGKPQGNFNVAQSETL